MTQPTPPITPCTQTQIIQYVTDMGAYVTSLIAPAVASAPIKTDPLVHQAVNALIADRNAGQPAAQRLAQYTALGAQIDADVQAAANAQPLVPLP